MKRFLSSPILNELRPFLSGYGALMLFSLCILILFLTGPVYMRQITDRVILSRNEGTLVSLAVIALIMILVSCILDLLRKKSLERMANAFDGRFASAFFDGLHRERSNSRSMSNATLLRDFNTFRDFLGGNSLSTVFEAIFSPIFIIAVMLVHWAFAVLALGMLIATIILAVFNYYFVRGDNARYQRAAISEAEFGSAISRNAESVRALGMLPWLTDRWYGLHSNMLGWQMAAQNRSSVFTFLTRFITLGQFITIYTLGAVLYLVQQVDITSMFMAGIIIMRTTAPLTSVIVNWRSYSAATAAVERLDQLLLDTESRPKRISLPPSRGPLVVSRLFATAPGHDKIILNDISFTLDQGRVLGVIGLSGAGKSCLARTLVRVWTPQRGTISIGDHEISHWDQDEFGRGIGYMAQEIELLPGTVAENIARFDPQAATNSAAVLEAAELAGIQDLVRKLPDGYNTNIGPGGHVLSIGQRHRVALARAVFGNPTFVVLDEPNANLDALGEQALVQMIQKLQTRGTTVVVVTHKLNLLAYCDDLLVLNAGTAQAYGPRDQIVSRIPRLKASPNLTVIEGSLDERRS